MALQRTLEMDFSTEANKTHRLRVYDAKADLTADDINTAMDSIVGANIFYGGGGEITGKLAARIVTREVSDIEMA